MHELLRQLEAEQIPPTRLTVDALVRGGRRKHRRRRLTAAAAVAAILPLGLGIGTAPLDLITSDFPESCSSRRLPSPGDRDAGIDDADPTGRFIVGRSGGDVVLWRGTTPTVLDPPGEAQTAVVNSAGVVAGTSTEGAWVFKGGRFTLLRGPDELFVSAINGRGDILGNSIDGPLVWQGKDLTPMMVPKPPGDGITEATSIDDDGTLVGYLHSGSTFTALVWPGDGTVHQLPAPAGMGRNTIAAKVRNARAIGQSGEPPTPTLWDLRTGEPRTLPGELTGAMDLNRAGWIAGVSQNGMPAITDLNGDKVLRPPVPEANAGAGWPWPVGPVTISDDGRVVAANLKLGGRDYAVRWLCY